jgi:3-hydroxyacyl-[acyl-carrier-protein] dehydratase
MEASPQQLLDALRHLPHGPEFRFVDRLCRLDPGKSGVGEYKVRGDEPFLRGHFPGEPIFPGVLLVEAAAQLAGTIAQSDPHIAPMPGLKLTALRGVKILGTAKPGETMQIEAEISGRLANLVQARATVAVNNQVILQAELTLSGESVPAEQGPH